MMVGLLDKRDCACNHTSSPIPGEYANLYMKDLQLPSTGGPTFGIAHVTKTGRRQHVVITQSDL